MRLGWRADAIDEWRDDVDADRILFRRQLEGLLTAKEIADAVADKLEERNHKEQAENVTLGNYRLDRWQARFAGGALLLALVLAVAGGIKGLVG